MHSPDPGHFPVSDPQTDAGGHAAKLHAAWRKQYDRADALDRDHAQAHVDLRDARLALQDAIHDAELAPSARKRALVEELTTKARLAEDHAAQPWAERKAATNAATETRRVAFGAYVDTHLEELLAEPELTDAAADARQGLLDALEAIETAAERFQEVRLSHVYLLSFAQLMDGQDVPTLGAFKAATNAARDVRDAIDNPGRGQSDPFPLPVPAEAALAYRRDRLAGIDQPPSQLTNIGSHR
jgi:hypothetical protein